MRGKKHLDLGAVGNVYPVGGAKIMRDKPRCISQVPARLARADEALEGGGLEASSRLVSAGHLLRTGLSF
eukprot:4343933-Pyramimonas_sp.AAC.1